MGAKRTGQWASPGSRARSPIKAGRSMATALGQPCRAARQGIPQTLQRLPVPSRAGANAGALRLAHPQQASHGAPLENVMVEATCALAVVRTTTELQGVSAVVISYCAHNGPNGANFTVSVAVPHGMLVSGGAALHPLEKGLGHFASRTGSVPEHLHTQGLPIGPPGLVCPSCPPRMETSLTGAG